MTQQDQPAWAQLKAQGNDAYRQGNIDTAIQFYGDALNSNDIGESDRATLLCNRAQCFLRQKDFDKAIADCTSCLTLSPKNFKALFRRAAAFEKLGNSQDALRDYRDALELCPGQVEIENAVARLDPSYAKSKRSEGSGRVTMKEEDYKEFAELEGRVKEVARQLASTKEKHRLCQREKRQVELTRSAVDELEDHVRTFRSMGKAFVVTPKPELTQSLKQEVEDADKKLKISESTLSYLDRQQKEADSNFMEFVKSLQSRQA